MTEALARQTPQSGIIHGLSTGARPGTPYAAAARPDGAGDAIAALFFVLLLETGSAAEALSKATSFALGPV